MTSSSARKVDDTEGGTAIVIDGGSKGVGFDELTFAPGMGRLLIPTGVTGRLVLVDPKTLEQKSIGAFTKATFTGGHDAGVTSAFEGPGVVLAIDRTANELVVVDPKTGAAAGSTKLASKPDRVRWVDATAEAWVSEPEAQQIEVFTLVGAPSRPRLIATVPVPDGPVSLLVDGVRARVYTHTTTGKTVAIEAGHHRLVGTWPNGCVEPRGIALDAPRGLLFAACREGKLVALDLDRNGKKVGSIDTPPGLDGLAYDPKPAHLVAPASESGTITFAGAGPGGVLTKLGELHSVVGAHCAVFDTGGRVFVCDPEHGRVRVVVDSFPSGLP